MAVVRRGQPRRAGARHRLRAGVTVLTGVVVASACSSPRIPLDAPVSTTAPTTTVNSTVARTTTGSTVATTTSTVVATTTAATAASASATLPPGAALPSDTECASRVVATPEVRPANELYNHRPGRQKNIDEKWLDRVTGDFTGTTDEILQWGACKWGIDPDIVRAQAAKESYWNMTNVGDFDTDPAACPPDHGLGVDGRPGLCPQSIGILQVRYPFHGPPANRPTWPEAAESTAYNVDYTYAIWRSCFEGDFSWLNGTERGAEYAAGDVWGCVGLWYSGRWHTQPAEDYIGAVQAYVNQRIWTTGAFINSR